MSSRIDTLAAALTLEEKGALLAGADLWHSVAIPRLGIGRLRVSDGPNGARGTAFRGGPTSACFPCGAALGATWNPALVERVAGALAEEALAKGARILLAPTINLQRTPLGGRTFECYAEDPLLTARLAVAFVGGLQARGVGACVKHFACNDVEWERHRASAEPDERTLREVYLAPFEAAVREARAWTVMSAYNRLHGTHCTEHARLLTDVLRGEWGFAGAVISDWLAVQSTAPSIAAGNDLEMPGPPRHYGAKLVDAVKRGELSEAAVDACVRRVLALLERTGVLDGGEPDAERAIDRPEHRALAREAAADAIVLLRNERAALPLAGVRRIAVVGPNADRAVTQGGGSARVAPHYAIAPLDGIRARAARAGVEVVFARGPSAHRGVPALDAAHLAPVPDALPIEVDLFASAEPGDAPVRTERMREAEAFWLQTPDGLAPKQPWSARLRARLVPPESGAHRFALASAGKSRLRVDGRAVLDNWDDRQPGTSFFGLGSAEVAAEVELRAGVAVEIEVDFAQDRPHLPGGLRLGWLPPEPADAMERAVEAARGADAAVVVVGLDPDWETEGRDRESFSLPKRQDELVAKVAAANPRTIVVVNAGSPVAMDWIDASAAALQLWYPGQESGNALADVLFGDVDPGGRLPLTIPVRIEDTPAFLDVPGDDLRIRYSEGLFAGHRWYDARAIAPRFAFGHGLSYARFEHGPLRAAQARVAAGDDVVCEIDVANASARAGKEVVQLYVARTTPGVRRPLRTLAAFEKVALAAGERRTLRLTVPARAFSYWDVAANAWRAEPGTWEIAAGRSSRELSSPLRIEVTAR
ncbi:MAG: glycosyl hydrolase [Proteobacteria bacterium]|nr:MAG: glycosyl hydrolase [Pseudomonadota bacterium]